MGDRDREPGGGNRWEAVAVFYDSRAFEFIRG